MEKEAQQRLERGLEQINVSLDEKQIRQLMQYLFALYKWNNTYNLTAIRDLMEMVDRHLLDSLVVWPFLKLEKIDSLADVGTGAGLPGIPLAIVEPRWRVTLIDSNSKKTGFLKHAQLITGLENVNVVTGRVEQQNETVDAVISRAFASLNEMATLTESIQKPDTVLWAMKGKFPEQELPELAKPYRVCASHQLTVPGTEGERHLLKITKSTKP